jgi:cytochrome c oxidase subunit 3
MISVSPARSTRSFRWGMVWFIFSEVMFFAGFFGALFYARNIAVPMLADAATALAGLQRRTWPTAGPGAEPESFPCRVGHSGAQHR